MMVADLTKLVRKARQEAMYLRWQTSGSTTADAIEEMASKVEAILNTYQYQIPVRPGDSRGQGWRVSSFFMFAGLHAR